MELDKSIKSYLDDIASNSPTPGGGNVSAFCGAVACSLGVMVCNLTIGKKKYLDVEGEMSAVKEELQYYKDRFISLAGKDNEAFEQVMEAFKLPKDTEDQKKIRGNKIEEATMHAADVPGEVIETCRNTLKHIKTAAYKGNQNSVSDAAVALSLLQTAAQGAFMNVLINCSSLANKTAGGEMLKRSEVLLNEVKDECSSAINNISKRLSQ
jgi:glutamate formiminotransferase/formiminotetrahydrofolate cyclodeaminase